LVLIGLAAARSPLTPRAAARSTPPSATCAAPLSSAMRRRSGSVTPSRRPYSSGWRT